MSTLRAHLAHHRGHMLVCAVAAVGMVAGIVFAVPVLAITGAVVCGVSCLMMIVAMIRGGHQHGRAAGA